MGDVPPRTDDAHEELTATNWVVFGIGLLTYILGFILLARNHPDLAPPVIVGGILAMLWAFLL
ncbi:MAG: hypothetical protein HY815_11435 [Candidatus Riflebacteria bacterium]|nr:hypothetical protein [Candidatus Riflebacteria bacterium]